VRGHSTRRRACCNWEVHVPIYPSRGQLGGKLMVISAGGTMMKTMMRERDGREKPTRGGRRLLLVWPLYLVHNQLSLSALHGVHTTLRGVYMYFYTWERERCAGYFQKITHHGLRWSSGALQGSPSRLNKNIILTHKESPAGCECERDGLSVYTAQCHTSKRRVFSNRLGLGIRNYKIRFVRVDYMALSRCLLAMMCWEAKF
jgi:hypothetical protein